MNPESKWVGEKKMKILSIALTAFAVLFLGVSKSSADTNGDLEKWMEQQRLDAIHGLEGNIRRPDTAKGVVVASPSKDNPNYFFHWIRDSALVMEVIVNAYLGAKTEGQKTYQFQTLMDYAKFSRTNQKSSNPSKQYFNRGIGEPKFNIDGTPFTGPWARPQNDGPALRASTLMRFARKLISEGKTDLVRSTLYDGKSPESTDTVIKVDLEYVSHHWRETNFDLWEEIRGQHFYTRMVQRKSMIEGAEFARSLGDPSAGDWYEKQARELEKEIEKHWDNDKGIIQVTLDRDDGVNYKYSGLDSAVILAVLHSSLADGFFNATDDRVLATAVAIRKRFSEIYDINHRGLPGTLIGRYPEDKYNGYHSDGEGNPWILATNAYAELYYRVAFSLNNAKKVTITGRNREFYSALFTREENPIVSGKTFENGNPTFQQILERLRQEGDRFLARVRHHTGPDGRMAEQMDRRSGYQMGAADLTWSYASFLSAIDRRNALAGRADATIGMLCAREITVQNPPSIWKPYLLNR